MSRDERATSFLRRFTAGPTSTLFRVLHLERHASPSLLVAVPGTLLMVGVLAYLAMERADQAALKAERPGGAV